MTMHAFATSPASRLHQECERDAANQLRSIIAGNRRLRFQGEPGEIELTPGLTQALLDMLSHIGSGDAVTILPVSRMLTTQQAADILNVSRPFLIGLLEKGEMPFEMAGRHRRVKAEHLLAYKQRRDIRRDAALAALAEQDADLL